MIHEVGQQTDLAVVFAGRGQNDFAQDGVGRFAMARADEADEAVGDDAGGALGVGERSFLDDVQFGRSLAGLAEAVHEEGFGVELGLDEFEAEDAAVVDVDGAGLDVLGGALRFADAGAVDVDDFGQPGDDVEMDVQADAGPLFAVVVAVPHGPSDVGGEGEEGAVDRQKLGDHLGQAAGQTIVRASLGMQPCDDRLQQGGIGDAVEIGQRAARNLGSLEMLASLPRPTEIFDDPQAFDRRIVKGEQMRKDDIIEKELLIAMRIGRRLGTQSKHLLVENAQVLRSLDRPWPVGSDRIVLGRSEYHPGTMR